MEKCALPVSGFLFGTQRAKLSTKSCVRSVTCLAVLHTFVSDRHCAVEVLLLLRPRRVVHLGGDATEAITVHFDGCR